MAKGSQLSQLKSALSQAGVTGKPSTSKKRKRSAVPLEKEKEKRAARLEEIHQRLNPFDVKVTKLKHEVGGRKLKGITGKPAQSKQAGIEQRKKTLLKEWEERDRAGGIVDRRFGENDPAMSLEERMLERFTRERQRSSKGVAFNLEDEDELTHYGQSLSKLDDFDNVGLGLDSEDEEESGQLDKEIVSKMHFGGFGDEKDDDESEESEEPARKKSKAEVMAEVIAKSKEHKLRRQMEKEQEENIRHELDNEFATLRDLLYVPDPSLTGSNTVPLGKPIGNSEKSTNPGAAILSLAPEIQDVDYDQHVRELAFDKRSKPKDRTKTEEELALEEKEALEKAEKQRRKRMLGLDDSGSEDEGRSKGKRKRGGDDLEDDFDDGGDEWGGLGTGLGMKGGEKGERASEEGESGKSGEEDEGTESGDEDESTEEGYDFDEEESDSEDEGMEQEELTTKAPKGKGKAVSSAKELPYTFPAPENHEEFLGIVEDLEDKDIPVVVQRIRTLYHTSLAPDNKYKLQTLANIIIDHILFVVAPPKPQFSLVSSLLPHLAAIVKAYPIPAAQFFNEKLTLMHKNLKRGLSRGAITTEARTWPGSSELTLLRIIGLIWPSSDLNHAVISPTRVLMGAYLGLSRVRSLGDIASGLFLCTLFLQYESLSKRFVPEALTFLANAFLHLAPTKYKDAASLPGYFPAPDFRSENCRLLAMKTKKSTPKPRKPDLTALLTLEEPSEQAKVDLLAMALDLLGRFADMYKGLDGFLELCEPILEIIRQAETKSWNEELRSRQSKLVDMLTRLLKFANQSRQPLTLQAHKPIPIPSYVPKFEATTSNYLRKKDPDYEKNEAAKLRYQLKQEKKGAIRELRKDAKFLAAVEQKRQSEKDREYNERLKKAFTSIESERAEQKAMEREKTREKRRAGRK
ncbi:Nop14-like protein [Macrolepiota fuliginosa MF-IS2]|uniref:Nop14-like protein n=1 Tax=Macrolepiota fuliginosa MF-IS2 TaxID=1400762 RepID=A0A9P5XHB0_9AGAR|nr:Nop14-like protein [Macrolepiota fuliginosa MF-IS2]